MGNEFDNDRAEEPVALHIDGVLDLHPFSPKDLKFLIPDYIEECLQRNIYELRIIHGKGKGNVRRSVQALLQRNPHVNSFSTAEQHIGGWGATIVQLKRA